MFMVRNIFSCLYKYLTKYTLNRKTNYHVGHDERMLQLVERSKDIIYWFDIKPVQKFRYLSPSIEAVLGQGLVQKCYENPNIAFELVHPDDYEILIKKINGEIDYNKPILQRWKNQNGEYIWFEEYATPIYENDQLTAIQGIIRNIDEKVKLHQDLEHRISHDYMTKICNRDFFENQVEELDKSIDNAVGIILCDLDELKFINDHYGHRKGDDLIKRTADLLNTYSSENVIVSRIGGDEFAILVLEATKPYTENLFRNISSDIENYNNKYPELAINLSKGYSYSTSSLGKMGDLFIDADRQMYKEKRLKKEPCLI